MTEGANKMLENADTKYNIILYACTALAIVTGY